MRLFLSLLLISILPSLAHAEPKRALVLPTQLNGYIPNRAEVQKALSVLIENRLKRVRVDIEPADGLVPDELQCADEKCMSSIADHHGVDLVVASRFINDEQRNLNAYHVWVRLFLHGEPVRTAEKDCPLCSEDKATDLLAVTVAETLAAPPAPPSITEPTVGAGKKTLRALSIVLAAGGAVSIGLGAWKATQNGEVSCSPVCLRRDTTAGMATALTVGVVAIAAAIPLAILGWRAPPRRVAATAEGVRISF